MKPKTLQIQQLESRMKSISDLRAIPVPSNGWLRSVRVSIGMSLEQLGRKLGISKQSAFDIERREKEGAVTLKALREAAAAMDMELIYGFVPKDGSLEAMIDRKSRELAQNIVGRASQTMILEEQGNTEERLTKAIEERVKEIKETMPKILWD